METIYLDYAATSPLAPGVLEAMLPYFTERQGNANALHQQGKQASAAVEEARALIAQALEVAPPELVFCSGGTEADNAALAGIATAIRRRKGMQANHVICAAFEHHAVLESVKALRSEGFEVSFIRSTREGFITPEILENAIKSNTILVSIMMAQNEIGTIQPIAELAVVAHQHGALFHTDAVQAFGKVPFSLRELAVDAASLSAHKIGGPKGVGGLYLKQGTPFVPLLHGGGQEAGRRSGTKNVAGIIGFAAAVAYTCDAPRRAREAARLEELRSYLVARLMALDVRLRLTVPLAFGDTEHHLPGVVSFTIEDFESEMLLLHLDEQGIAVSGGSACSSSSLEPSHVLTSLGIPKKRAHGALRISFGEQTTREHLDTFLAALSGILELST